MAKRIGRTPPVVVDASIAAQWFAHEPGSDAAARLLEGDQPLLAPEFMMLEAAKAWWKKTRRHEMDAADAAQALTHLLAIGIEWVPAALIAEDAFALALEKHHAVYDSAYLVVARRRGAAIATADGPLRSLAVSVGVRIWR